MTLYRARSAIFKKHVNTAEEWNSSFIPSCCVVRGTLVLVLYYIYTYLEPIKWNQLFTVLLPIPLLSISDSLELHFQISQTGSSIITIHTYINVTNPRSQFVYLRAPSPSWPKYLNLSTWTRKISNTEQPLNKLASWVTRKWYF